MDYFAGCGKIYRGLWYTSGTIPQPLDWPELPVDYQAVFSNCIRYADPSVGDYLSGIIVRLQVHHARLREAVTPTSRRRRRIVDKHALIVYFFCLGELYTLSSNLFRFARGEAGFEERVMNLDDFRTAYNILDIDATAFSIDDEMNLWSFTKRKIEEMGGNISADERTA